ncbi:MAG: D-alanyl-D-alanine carboxypeptidase family protein [Patescibacteria group bacterium]
MNGLDNKKSFVLGAFCFGCAVLLFVFLSGKVPGYGGENRLAQIIEIETGLLREWQQRGSLKNNLSYGESGSDVLLLQRMLSEDKAIYPEQATTGHYGERTVGAVKNFQKEYGLVESGIVDDETRERINEIFLSRLCPREEVVYPDFMMKKVGSAFAVPLDYTPPSLEDVSRRVRTAGVVCLRSDVAPQIERMFSDAKKDDVELMITSGYRTPEIQKHLYDFWLSIEGGSAIDEIAKPGLSEHQLGTTVDLTDSSIKFTGVDDRFAHSKGGRWMRKNAHQYGFTMSFPNGKKEATGFSYEPWHWRFVGVQMAKALYAEKLAYNESKFDLVETPSFREGSPGLQLSAGSFVAVFVDSAGSEKILLEKEKELALPIASITKLMVALVSSEKNRSEDTIVVSEQALRDKGVSGIYHAGDMLSFENALHALLVASHNEIANAIALRTGANEFLAAMNKKAESLGLLKTSLVNISGTDPEIGSDKINQSTAFDLYKLMRHIQETRSDLLAITSKKDFGLFAVNGSYIARLQSTNKLLGREDVPLRVLGGKTGETPRAGQNLVVVTEAPCSGRVYAVVLGAQGSFEDMKRLLWYVNDSYAWCDVQDGTFLRYRG